jgi:hypothetical protein
VPHWKHSKGSNLIHFRIDFVDLNDLLRDFDLTVARPDAPPVQNTLCFAGIVPSTTNPAQPFHYPEHPISWTWHFPALPVIHAQFDYVTFSVPVDEWPENTRLIWRGIELAVVLAPGEL